MSVSPLRYTSAPARRTAILAVLQDSGFAAITDMARDFGVSDMTVRRDVRRLEAEGEVRVVHGGVSLRHGTLRTPDFLDRAETGSEAKRLLAAAAAELVRPHDVIAVDSGTTAFQLAAALPDDFDGTVVTTSVPVIQLMLTRPRTRVIALGGELVPEHQAFVGDMAVEAASRVRVRLFFLGAAAVDTAGVYMSSTVEAPVKRALLRTAAEVVLLADAEKVQRSAPVQLCSLDEVDRLVTDQPPAKDLVGALEAAGVTLHAAPGPARGRHG